LRSLAVCLIFAGVVWAADIPQQRVSVGDASFVFSDIRVSRDSAVQKDGVPHFSALVQSHLPVATRGVRFSVEFTLSGGRTESVTVDSRIFYPNQVQPLSYTFLPPYKFSAAEITGVSIRFLTGQMAKSRPGMTYDGFVATSEPCLVEYLQATRRSGAELQQSLTDLLDRGCGSFVVQPMIVTPITSRFLFSGRAARRVPQRDTGQRLDRSVEDGPNLRAGVAPNRHRRRLDRLISANHLTTGTNRSSSPLTVLNGSGKPRPV
jgi:hypothetical protein